MLRVAVLCAVEMVRKKEEAETERDRESAPDKREIYPKRSELLIQRSRVREAVENRAHNFLSSCCGKLALKSRGTHDQTHSTSLVSRHAHPAPGICRSKRCRTLLMPREHHGTRTICWMRKQLACSIVLP